MEAKDVVRFKNIYSEQRRKVMQIPPCDYEALVRADVIIGNLISWVIKDVDETRANMTIKDPNGKDYSEAKIERLLKNKTIDERHLLRITEDLQSTIKSKQYMETK